MLKRKIEINYRKAVSTRDGRHNRCKNCGHRMLTDIVKDSSQKSEVRSQKTTKEWRCEVIGLGNSRAHEAEADHVCDHVAVTGRQVEA